MTGVDHQLLTLLQLCDTAFPTGAFSHSSGFESALKHHFVNDKASYKMHIIASLENTACKMLPFIAAAYSDCSELESLVQLDGKCGASLTNHVESRSSSRQGRSLIGAGAQVFSGEPGLDLLAEAVDSGQLAGHLPVMYGALCGTLRITLQTTLLSYLHTVLKTITTSSVRLGFTGPVEAQSIHRQLHDIIPELVNRYRDLSTDDVHTCFIPVDVLQNVHDTMFTKHFYS